MSLELFYDVTEPIDGQQIDDVRVRTNEVVALTRIKRDIGAPTGDRISWGDGSQDKFNFPFVGVITSLTQNFTLFSAAGKPLRATLSVKILESLDWKKDELETDPEFTTRLVKRGDSLSSIAHEVYRDPTRWRVIAEANHIDDPRHLTIGLRLAIPKNQLRIASMAVANLSHPLVPVCDVLINGQLWTAEEKAHITRVTVEESLDKAGELTLEFFEPFEYNQQPTWLDDLKRFALGGEVEIKMGYAGDLETLMVGDIIRLEPSFSNSQFSLTSQVMTAATLAARSQDTLPFMQQKASDIAAQIAQDARLTAETTDSQVIHDYLLQDNKSDWEFLSKLAQEHQV